MSLAELIGNTRIKATLASYLRNERVPSSLIFTGSDAYHQLLFAMNFAKSLDLPRKTTDACDRCRPCLAIDRNIFPDVQVLAPEGQFYRKNQMDELIATASQRPLQGEKRVFILKDAQRLNESAANAFLKTLEEPLPTNVFILLTANLNLILPTIQSRCQILKFLPLSNHEIKLELQRRGVDPEKSRLLAFFNSDSLENVAEVDWQELEEKRRAMLCILDRLHAPERGRGHPARPLRPQPQPRELHRLFPRDGQFDFRAVTGYNGADGRCRQRHAHQFGLQGKAHGTGGLDRISIKYSF